MNKYSGLKLVYTCAAACPPNIYLDRIYTLNEEENGFSFTDGNYTEYVEKKHFWYIKMLFTPRNTSWEEIEKLEVVKPSEKIIVKK